MTVPGENENVISVDSGQVRARECARASFALLSDVVCFLSFVDICMAVTVSCSNVHCQSSKDNFSVVAQHRMSMCKHLF